MAIGAAIAGSVVSGIMANQAADETSDAARGSVAEQRRQFNLLREDLAPYRGVGRNALYQQAAMLGMGSPERQQKQARLEQLRSELAETDKFLTTDGRLGYKTVENPPGSLTKGSDRVRAFIPGETTINPEFERRQQEIAQIEQDLEALGEGGGEFDIAETPGYQFRFDQGLNALDQSLAATGNRFSGRAIKAAQRYGQGLASQEFSNRFNRLAGLAGTGQTATTQTGQAGMQMAGNVGNALMAGGRARAAGYAGMNQAIQGGIGNYLSYRQNEQLLNQLGDQGGMRNYRGTGGYGYQAGRV